MVQTRPDGGRPLDFPSASLVLEGWATYKMGSLLIGVVLIGVAVFLAVEVKSLIIGEAADPEIEEAVRATIAEDTQITGLLRLITVQQGPGEVVVAMKGPASCRP